MENASCDVDRVHYVPLATINGYPGWYESYPLNGPAWTLFYEYIANILYAG
jgi:hypothetical protein